MVEFDIFIQLELIHICLGVVIDVPMMHELDLFFWKGEIREVVVVFGHIYVCEVHNTVAVRLKAPQAAHIVRFLKNYIIYFILLKSMVYVFNMPFKQELAVTSPKQENSYFKPS